MTEHVSITLIVSLLQAVVDPSATKESIAQALLGMVTGLTEPSSEPTPTEPVELERNVTSSGGAVTIGLFGASPEHLPMPSTEGETCVQTFRSQLVLFSDPVLGTYKLHFHYLPDIVGPHDHPWCHLGGKDAGISFEATVLNGGYTEERFTKQVDGTYVRTEHTYQKGDRNRMPFGVFHRIIKIEPGTVTLMVTGPRTKENKWSFLDPATGETTDPGMNPEYIARRNAINPQLVKPKTA